MKRFIVLVAVFLVSPLWGVPTKVDELASHQDEGGIGDNLLRFHPFIEAEYRHNDNLNNVENGARGDHLGILRPGFSTVWSNHETTYLSLQYQLEVEQFLRNTALDTLNHMVDVKADWNWEPLYLFVRERYLDTNDQSYTSITQLIQRRDDRQNVTLGVQKNRLTAELQGEHFNRTFESPLTVFDYSIYGLNPSASWDWTESQRMLIDARWNRLYYPNDAARSGHLLQSRAGWEFHPTDHFKTQALAGFASRHVDGPGLNSFDGWIGEWTFNSTHWHEHGYWQGGYRTGVEESIDDGGSSYYREHRLQTTLGYAITSKVAPSISLSWARLIYGNPHTLPGGAIEKRSDDVTTVVAQLKYSITDQFSVVPSYRFEHRASNIPLQNYETNTLSLTCRYAL